jgi:hypothetical protein
MELLAPKCPHIGSRTRGPWYEQQMTAGERKQPKERKREKSHKTTTRNKWKGRTERDTGIKSDFDKGTME